MIKLTREEALKNLQEVELKLSFLKPPHLYVEKRKDLIKNKNEILEEMRRIRKEEDGKAPTVEVSKYQKLWEATVSMFPDDIIKQIEAESIYPRKSELVWKKKEEVVINKEAEELSDIKKELHSTAKRLLKMMLDTSNSDDPLKHKYQTEFNRELSKVIRELNQITEK